MKVYTVERLIKKDGVYYHEIIDIYNNKTVALKDLETLRKYLPLKSGDYFIYEYTPQNKPQFNGLIVE